MQTPKPYDPTVNAIELEPSNGCKRFLFEWKVPNPNYNPPNPTRSRFIERRKTEHFVASQGAREWADLMERKLRREYPVDNAVKV